MFSAVIEGAGYQDQNLRLHQIAIRTVPDARYNSADVMTHSDVFDVVVELISWELSYYVLHDRFLCPTTGSCKHLTAATHIWEKRKCYSSNSSNLISKGCSSNFMKGKENQDKTLGVNTFLLKEWSDRWADSKEMQVEELLVPFTTVSLVSCTTRSLINWNPHPVQCL